MILELKAFQVKVPGDGVLNLLLVSFSPVPSCDWGLKSLLLRYSSNLRRPSVEHKSTKLSRKSQYSAQGAPIPFARSLWASLTSHLQHLLTVRFEFRSYFIMKTQSTRRSRKICVCTT